MNARSGHIPTHSTASLDLPFKNVDDVNAGAAFGFRQHIHNLHPENSVPGSRRRGVITLAQRVADRDRPWREWTVPVGGDAVLHAEELLSHGEVTDLYISQAAFRRWRGIADLTVIGANFVDLDYHKRVRWCRTSPRDVAMAVIGVLEEERIPLPSLILSTGRGLCCLWLTELLPVRALPRWNAVQKRLADVLTRFGADKRALDAARVFRLTGSVNSRADYDRRHVGLVWCQGSQEVPHRYQFGTLADEVLPFTRAQLISLRAERATRKAEGRDKDIRPALKLTEATYYSTVFEDLQSLRVHRNPETGALAAGHRDVWIFVAATALSWMAAPTAMESQIRILAAQTSGWTESEAASRMSTVVKRAQMAARGELLPFDGRDVDPRYRMRANTIVEWLGIESAEMRDAGLRVLVDKDRRRELNTERTARSRHCRGVKDRGEQRAARLELGRKALYLSAKDDMSVRELANHFGVSVGQMSKAMTEARQFSQ